jgi:3-oxoadipate enol-lactonase
MDDFAADLQALLDHLGLARVIYCGLSMGGYIGFAFVRRYPATGRADAGRYPRGR